jgi:hypothetical protein
VKNEIITAVEIQGSVFPINLIAIKKNPKYDEFISHPVDSSAVQRDRLEEIANAVRPAAAEGPIKVSRIKKPQSNICGNPRIY